MKTTRVIFLTGILVIIALLITSPDFSAVAESGAIFYVNENFDDVDAVHGDGICEVVSGNHECTLRAAIQEANAFPGADTIYLPASTYHLTLPGGGSGGGDLDITYSVTIIGDQDNPPTIDATGLGARVFAIAPGSGPVSMSYIIIRNGYTMYSGGGIWSSDPLDLYEVDFVGNHADYSGGAIYTTGPLIMDNVDFNTNISPMGGGIYISTATGRLNNVSFRFSDSANVGGAIYNDQSTLTVNNTLIDNNNSPFGGGIYNDGGGEITLSNVQFTNNSANFGGGIYNNNGIIIGTKLLFDRNVTTTDGSAIASNQGSSSIDQSVFSSNQGRDGTIINYYSTFYLTDSTLISNTVDVWGAGFKNHGIAKIVGVTFTQNSASSGGAIFNSTGTLSLTNSTISGNTVSESGGGIYNSANVIINNSTITNNMSTSLLGEGGGIYNSYARSVIIRNSILYGNHLWSYHTSVDEDCHGALYTQHYNLIGTLVNCTLDNDQGLDLKNQDPLLGVLANNNGPTQTHALLEGSPAIDAGNPTGCFDELATMLTTDQRGYLRVWDGDAGGTARCDIGSYEYASRLLFFLPVTSK